MSRPAAYDLHLHSVWSYDALAEVEPYFRRAEELGVRAIAVTEHHNLDSIAETLAAAARYPRVRMIPAAELTVTTSLGPADRAVALPEARQECLQHRRLTDRVRNRKG